MTEKSRLGRKDLNKQTKIANRLHSKHRVFFLPCACNSKAVNFLFVAVFFFFFFLVF